MASALFMGGSAYAQTDVAAASRQTQIKACGETVSVHYHAPGAGVPASVQRFMGQWGNGNQGWDVVLCHVLAVTRVNKAGDVSAVYIYGAFPAWGMNTPGKEILSGKISGNVLSLTTNTGTLVTYKLKNSALAGRYRLGNKTYYITLPKAH